VNQYGQFGEEKKIISLPGPEFQHLRRPARSRYLHRLRYPGSVGEKVNYCGTSLCVLEHEEIYTSRSQIF
jgi:hypothetical protein